MVLESEPTVTVRVSVTRTGDRDVTVGSTSLTFTASDWEVAQTVRVRAGEDGDAANGTATIVHGVSSSGDYDGVTASSVTVTERDSDADSTAVSLSVLPGVVPEASRGQAVVVTATLNGGTRGAATEVAVTVGVGGDGAESVTDYGAVAGFTLTIPADTASGTATFTLSPVDDKVDEADETLMVGGTVDGGGLNVLSAELTITDDDERGVAVTPTALTVDEGGSTAYTVVLESEPTVTVRVSVTRTGDRDVTVGSTSLTFTASDWEVAQTVRVRAGEDGDAANGTATIVHGVSSSGDYDGVTASSVTVTERDSDADSTAVSLSVLPGVVPEASRGQAVVVTATLNGGTRGEATEIAVTVGVGGDGAESVTDYGAVAGFTLTIPADTASGTATFTLSPVDDKVDEADESVTVGGTVAGGGLNVLSAELTITDDDERGVAVTPTALTVDEGGSAAYTVVLESEPTETVTVSVTRTRDRDVTVGSASLTFTASDWDVAQTVRVRAGEDGDAANGTATMVHGVSSSGDYDRVTADWVTVTERDNDTASTAVSLRVLPAVVPEASSGQAVVVTGRLNGGTRGEATEIAVTVGVGGDGAESVTDYGAVAGFTLTIPADTASGTATFTLSPVDDKVDEADESVTVGGTVDGGGLNVLSAELTITDDDERGVAVTPTALTVDEGGSAAYTVVLESEPTVTVRVSVTRTGDRDVTVGSASLTFTASDWDVAQTVRVRAGEDGDAANGTATMVHGVSSSGDYDRVTADWVTVTERDNDAASTAVSLRVLPAVLPEASSGQAVVVTGRLNGGTRGEATEIAVTVGVGGDGAESVTDYGAVAGFTLTIPADTASGTATFTLSPVDDKVDEADESVTVGGTVDGGGLNVLSAELTITDDDERGVAVTPTALTVDEGGSTAYTVVLESEPTVTVRVSVTRTGDRDVTVGSTSLTFTASDWEVAQTVRVRAGEDGDAANGTATIVHGVSSSGDYDGVTASSVTVTERDSDADSTAVSLSVLPGVVPEASRGQAVVVTATLNGGTRGEATEIAVTVGVGGDGAESVTDYGAVAGFTLTIPADTASGTATFTLSPVDDKVDEADESVTVGGTVDGGGLNVLSAELTITDDDERGVAVTPTALTVDEGGSAAYTVVLESEPTETVTVSVTRTRDRDVTVGSASLTFTASDWDVAQTVRVRAGEDGDAANGTATMVHGVSSSGDYDRVTADWVTVTERDNDTASTAVSLRVLPAVVPEASSGQAVVVTGRLNGGTRGEATEIAVTVGVGGDGAESVTDYGAVAGFTLTIPADTASGTATFTLSPVDDKVDEADESVTVGGTVDGGGLNVLSAELTITDDDERGVAVTPTALTVDEGGSTAYTVVLESEPTVTVRVSVTRTGDRDVTVGSTSLTFTASDWEVAQTVRVRAGEDGDAANGTATIVHGVSSSGDYDGVTASSVTVTERDSDADSTAVSLSVLPGVVPEASRGQAVVVTATLNGGTRGEATEIAVTVGVGGDGAESVTDYGAVAGFTLTIPADTASGTATFTLSPVDDKVDEADESVTVGGTVDGGGLNVLSAELTITDDDERGVAVTPTALTVDEGGSTAYTVVLESEPTVTVRVSVTRTGDRDVTVGSTSLTFTASDWEVAQTVRVRAGEDGDAANGTATIVHGVSSSGDYDGVTASSVTVTERDSDADSTAVSLSVLPGVVPEASRGQAVVVTATLNGGTRGEATEIAVTVGVGGDGAESVTDYGAVAGFTLTIPADTASGTATFTLSPVDDKVDEADESVTVGGTVDGGGLNVLSAELTITDDDERGVAVTPTALTVDEGGSTAYTVVLESEPTVTVRVSVTRTGDRDVTVGSTSLTFTASDWEVAQTVRVRAGEDGDAANGTATIVHGVSSSGDYGGEAASSVTVTERDSDADSTAVSLSVLPGVVPEASRGQAVVVTATLNGGTRGAATEVAVTVGVGGDGAESVTDYGAVAGFTLTIPADTASGTATFTLSPVDDKVDEADESVTVGGTVDGGGLNVLSAELTITDDDERGVAVTPTALTVDEGGSTAYTVVLESEPTVTVRVSVTRTGDRDVTVGSTSLTFTASDWEVAQTVRVRAGEDGDAANGTATIVHGVSSSGDYDGVTASSVTVTERDSDADSTAVSLSVLPGVVPEASRGQAVVVTATLNGGTRGAATEIAVTVGVGGDGAESVTDYGAVAGFTLTIPADTASGTATFTLSPVDDKVDEADESVTVGGTVDGGGLNVLSAELTITDDDERGVAVTPTALTVDEGGSTAYTVVLESEPTVTVRVSVTRTGDRDVTVGSTSLTFTASDWEVAQTVRVRAGEDGDAANGTATIVHGVSSSGDYDGVTASSVTVTERDSDADSTAVSLSVLPGVVPEASRGQAVVVTATLNGGTRGAATEVAVTVGVGGDGAESVTDYGAVAGFTLTIPADTASGTATFTLSPVDDKVDEADESVTVGGTVDGGGLNVLSAELTITDDDERGVAVTPTALTVDEGGSTAYTVVLESEPTVTVRVSVSRTGDGDVTVGSTSLTFTASDWEVAQTVRVRAGEDGDAANGTATIVHGVSSSGDYDGVTASSVTVTERDSDADSTAVSLSVLPGVVPEASRGQAVVVTATLNGGTRGEATEIAVTVGVGGDGAESVTDYGAVAGFTLTIPADTASGTATFTLSPVDDKVDEADESVTVGGTVDGGGLNVLSAELTITDDDERGVAVTPTALTVDEGGSTAYTVVLESEPTVTVRVSVSRTGDGDVTVGSASLTFTASDWDVAQTVRVSAGEDGDAANGTATMVHGVSSSGDYDRVTAASVTVTERDSDTASTSVTLSVLPTAVPEASRGQAVVVTATLNGGTRGAATEVAVTVGVGGDGAESVTDYEAVAGFTLTIPADSATGTATFTLSPVGDRVDEENETLTVGGTVAGGGLNVLSAELTITDDDERGVAVTPTALTVDEGGSTAYTVVLESEPTESVTVSVTGTGDGDVTVGSTSLTFTASDWDVAQTVRVSAGEDGDAANGTATIVHGVSSSGDYDGVTAASVTVTERDSDTDSTAVSLSVLPAAVPEASSGQAVVVTATLNGGTRGDATEVAVTVGAGGDGAEPVTDYGAVAGFTLMIAAEQVSGTATFTLSPVGDKVDEADETLMVGGTVAGGGLNVLPAELTITDDDERGVAVAPTALTVDEGGSTAYTVVLESEPTESVTVSVTGTGDGDVTVGSASLTFTASDWEVAQTVRVRAGEDGDAANGTATIVHGVSSSGDYDGVTAASVTVTERDSDTDSTAVSLSVLPTAVPEASSGQAVVVTATLNGGTRGDATEVAVTVGAGGDGAEPVTDYGAVAGFTLMIAAEQVSGTATFTLSPVGDKVDEADETLMVGGTVAGGGLNVLPAELTITDDDERGVAVAPTALTVDEGGSAAYTVVLESEPTVTVTVSVSRDGEGDVDVTVGSASLTFTASDWDVAQTVRVSAGEDGDAANGTATIVHGVSSGGDYGGETADSVTVTERDSDTASTSVSLSVLPGAVPEASSGQAVVVTGRLNGGTRGEVTEVAVTVGAGGDGAETVTDYGAVAGFTLTIPADTASGTATFTLSPVGDKVDEADESVTVGGTVAGGGGLNVSSAELTITDDDERGVAVAPTALTVDEGGSTAYTVVLESEPTETVRVRVRVRVSVTRDGDGDGDVTVGIASLTFTASDWEVAQTVTVSAGEDGDAVNGTATIVHGVSSSGDYGGETAESVTVTERDSDTASTAVSLSVLPGAVPEASSGQAVVVTATLNSGTRGEATKVAVTVGAGGDGAESATDYGAVAGFTLTIPADSVSGTATFTLSPVGDKVDEADESVTVGGTVAGGGGLNVLSAELTITDDDERGVTVAPTALTVDEGGSTAYTVVLESEPTETVRVSVTRDGDGDVTVGSASLTFTASDWEVAQTVRVSAGEDGDAANGTATIVHGVSSSGDYGGEAAASVTVTERDSDTASTAVSLSVLPGVVPEASSGQAVVVTATLNSGTRGEATEVAVTVGAGGDGAEPVTDYGAVAGFTLTIPADTASGTATFTLSPVDDKVDEADETLTVGGTVDGGGLNVLSAELTITDDDERGVAVTPTGLTVDEGGSTAYTVVLESEPTETVRVSVTGTGDGDVTVGSTSLTFTASDWEVAQTVRVSAGEDEDAANGTATIVHGVSSSGDYDGEAAASVTVTERDSDTDSTAVSLSVLPTAVPEASSGQAVVVTATLNGGTRGAATEVAVTVGAGGDGAESVTDYEAVAGFTLMIAAEQVSGTATFTLSPVGDKVDEADETLTVGGIVAGGGLNVLPAELTITDDDERGVAVAPTALTVDEGGSAAYTVVLESEPTESVRVSVTRTGDRDVTVGSTSLTFTASDWDVAQTVTVSAGEDGDAANGTATMVHGVSSSGDYGGETAESVTVTERDSDTASTAVSLSVLPGVVPEASSGQAVVVTATLNGGTRGEATEVAVTVGAGGDGAEPVTDYGAVAGFTLTIAAEQVSGTATFTLSPVDDKVDEADESVTVGGTVDGGGLNVLPAELTITDDDERGVAVAPTALKVDEGGSAAYTVVLESEPTESVTVSVTRTGDRDVTVGSTSLTFTASNWETAQTVRVSAGEDGDAANGTATIAHGVSSSGDYGGATVASVTVTERDSDTASTSVTLSVLPGAVPEASSGQAVVVTATLNGGTRGEATEVAVTVGAGGDGAEPVTDYGAVAGFTLTITAEQVSGTATFTLSPVDDKVDEADETLTVGGTVAGGGLNVLPAELTITDDDERGVAVAPTALTVDEGGSTAYTVVLESEPTGTVTVRVTRDGDGDGDVTVGSASLTFTASDWDVAQTVTVSAGEDGDAANGTATIVHGVSSSGDYGGETAESVTVTERDSDTASTAVTLSVLPAAVPEASAGAAVVVTATLNGGTRGEATEVTVALGHAVDTADPVTDYAAVKAFTLTIEAEQVSGTATFTLSPVDDKVDEEDETVMVSGTMTAIGLSVAPAAVTMTAIGLSVAPAAVTITDDDTSGVSVSPTALTVDEGGSGTYTVVLASEPTESVTVSVTVSGDEDLTVDRTSLTFTASDWETAQTVTVSAGDDEDVVNGTATIAQEVASEGDYGGLNASSVSVTEQDNDRGGVTPQAWLARFGRTVADQVIDAVDGRLREAPRSGFQGRIAGQSLPGAPLAAADDRPGAARQVSNTVAPHTHDSHEPDDEWPRIRGVMDRDLLTGTSFVLTAGSKESGYRSVWGRGAIARFDGRTRDLSLDGEVLSGMVGADWSRGRGVAGLLAAHSRGEGSFRGAQGESRIEAAVTGFYPYGRYAVNERFSAWGVAGYGEGDLTLVPDGGAALTAGMDLTMVAMGGRGVLLTWPEYGGLELAAKFDAMATRINSESVAGAMEAARAEVMRGRLGLEGTWRGWQVSSGRIAPAFEIGIRYDGGDAETGFGADIGGGLAWSDSERGIKAEVRARGLITHQDRSFRERGLSGTFTWDADASSALGWSLALRQTLGPSASDGMDALLSRVTAGFGFNGEDESDQRRFEATLGYGVALFGGRFAGTPEVGLALSDAGREYSVGWRLSLNQRGRTSFTLAVQATRRETLNHTPEYGVDLRLAAHW